LTREPTTQPCPVVTDHTTMPSGVFRQVYRRRSRRRPMITEENLRIDGNHTESVGLSASVGAFHWQPSLSESVRVWLGLWPDRLCRPLAGRHSAKGRRGATDVGTRETFIRHSPLRERSAAARAHHTETLELQSSTSGSVLGGSRCLCSPGARRPSLDGASQVILTRNIFCV